MLKGLFNKKDNSSKQKQLYIFNPIEGEIISIEDVPDEVFAKKMLGDGFAIVPNDNKVYSPVSGEIKLLFPTLHAVAIETEEGIELLVHIGIDTVKLNGEGFTAHIKVGDKVKQGDLLLSFDKDIIEARATSSISPIVITNMDKVSSISVDDGVKLQGEKVVTVELK